MEIRGAEQEVLCGSGGDEHSMNGSKRTMISRSQTAQSQQFPDHVFPFSEQLHTYFMVMWSDGRQWARVTKVTILVLLLLFGSFRKLWNFCLWTWFVIAPRLSFSVCASNNVKSILKSDPNVISNAEDWHCVGHVFKRGQKKKNPIN